MSANDANRGASLERGRLRRYERGECLIEQGDHDDVIVVLPAGDFLHALRSYAESG